MKFSKFAATSALVIAALGISAGTVHAAPAPALPAAPDIINGLNQAVDDLVPAIHWNAAIEGDSVVLTTDAGAMTTKDDQFQLLDNKGGLVTAFPLGFVKDGMRYPIHAAIDGLRAVLTPEVTPAAARPADLAVHEVVQQKAFDDAVSAAGSQFGVITAVGTLIGTLVGGVAGCALGAFLGTPVLLPGWVGGCFAGALIGIPLGAAAGLVLTGVPAAIIVGIGFFQRINDPANQ
ncbi:hypothetical protein [Nocardia acidivorans]|uniref:hypothetical protein n=1 Tax=Nocardia acidivorans TaxID=404580 RepID=UPI00082B0638|nr:hypothetical protein [Nocardia acidivorans]